MMGAVGVRELGWYAVRLKQRQNGGRRTTVLGAEFETYRSRSGRMCKRQIKGSGDRVFVPEYLLQKSGFEVFLPVKKKWCKVSRFKSEKELRSFPLLAGWLFVGWPRGENRFHELVDMDVVAGVMGAGGCPVMISDEEVRGMMRRYGANKCQDRDLAGRRVAKGDLVRVDAGPFDGKSFRVVETTAGSVKGVLALFGRDVVVEVGRHAIALV